jgi:hypothetical protein
MGIFKGTCFIPKMRFENRLDNLLLEMPGYGDLII